MFHFFSYGSTNFEYQKVRNLVTMSTIRGGGKPENPNKNQNSVGTKISYYFNYIIVGYTRKMEKIC
jgi:hypothetical protein